MAHDLRPDLDQFLPQRRQRPVTNCFGQYPLEIAGLVVAKAAQRSGIGSRLVGEAERWARGIGAEFISVRSNINRAESHPFYQKLGYELKKTQQAYRKRL